MESRQLRADSNLFTPSNFNSQFNFEENIPDGHSNDLENYEEYDYVSPSEDWFEVRSITENAMLSGVTSTVFDSLHELIWTGFNTGKVISYYVSSEGTFDKYSSFFCHQTEIRSILTADFGLITISPESLRMSNRGGVNYAIYSTEHMIDLQTVMFLHPGSSGTVVLGGATHMLVFDIAGSRFLKEVPISYGIMKIKPGSLLSCAHNNGLITLRDPKSFNIQSTIQAYSGGITDMDINGELLITCGWSGRSESAYVEPYIKVFDLRTLKPLDPIPFIGTPFLAKFHPTQSNTIVAVSESGQFQFLSISNQESKYYQVETDGILTFDISSNGEALLFGDVSSSISEWSNKEQPQINSNSLPLVITDYAPAPPKIKMDLDSSPLSLIMIPASQQNNSLLSYWDPKTTFSIPPAPLPFDKSVFPDFKQVDFVGYATNPGLRRNQMVRQSGIKGVAGTPARRLDILLQPKKKKARPPVAYRHVEIKHTKLGIEGFDFASYNRTYFAGLENTLPNSYCNSGLQVLYFIPQLRLHMLNHLCKREFCLSCELGFLFHMLDNANNTGYITCQASNFLRSFRQIPQASGLGLTETPADDQKSLVRLMENFNRFILEQLHQESISNPNVDESHISHQQIIDQLFGATSRSHSKCLSCKHETRRETRSFQYDMVYQDTANEESFASLLKSSLYRETQTKAWCERCARYQLTEQHRELTSFPNILCINTAASKTDIQFWKSKYDSSQSSNVSSWLPLELQLKRDPVTGKLLIEDDPINDISTVRYELTAAISHVYDVSKKASKHSHLVTQIKVHSSYHAFHGSDSSSTVAGGWYLFNDFLITPCTIQEVVDFSFRSPCVLYYKRIDLDERMVREAPINPISEEVFFTENPIKRNNYQPLNYIPLSRQNLPKRGDIVAIDSEFVSLGAEEAEIKTDGSRVVINPCHFSLARVSVIRGQGLMAGEPFIDDYIVTSEQVVDYLTRYSGISPGDLDPKISKHHLTTLKAVYLKLRCLIDRGCRFVGHGLAKDFRIINILVPPEQILDTVEIYHLEGQRKISLKFLARWLLGMDIQEDTHDSIEDARTALLLYNKYVELKKENQFEDVLLKIYEIGRQTKWAIDRPK